MNKFTVNVRVDARNSVQEALNFVLRNFCNKHILRLKYADISQSNILNSECEAISIKARYILYYHRQSIGAEWAVLPLRVKANFYDLRSPLRSRFATSRSALRSTAIVFSDSPSPLRSAHLTFWPPLRFPLRSRCASML